MEPVCTTIVVRPTLKIDVAAATPDHLREQIADTLENLVSQIPNVSLEGWDILVEGGVERLFSTERFVAVHTAGRWRVLDTKTGEMVPASGGSKRNAEVEAVYLNQTEGM
jgi:hypothetical protein